MKFIRNLVALFAVLQLVSNAQAFFGGYGYGGYYDDPFLGGPAPYWGGYGYPSKGAFAADVAVGGISNIVGAAVTADAIKKASPGYQDVEIAKQERRTAEARAREAQYRSRYN